MYQIVFVSDWVLVHRRSTHMFTYTCIHCNGLCVYMCSITDFIQMILLFSTDSLVRHVLL